MKYCFLSNLCKLHFITFFLCSALICNLTFGSSVLSGWENALDLGLTLTRGNSETTLITSNLSLDKKVPKHAFHLAIGYTFNNQRQQTVTDEITGEFGWNRVLDNNAYYGLRFQGRRDDIARIDYRTQSSTTIGKYFIKEGSKFLSVESGIGYNIVSINQESTDNAHLYMGEQFSTPLSKTASLTQNIASYLDLDELGGYNFIFNLSVKSRITESMDLNVTLQDKYESRPAVNAVRNDIRLVSGFSYKF